MKPFAFFCAMLCANVLLAQIFVDDTATGDNDGSSWSNAYIDLSLAIEFSQEGEMIWVAEGTYFPTETTDRSKSFELKNEVQIYGGFNGNEGQLSERDIVENRTILSGDIGQRSVVDDNSYHVIANKGNGVDRTAILDGFYITLGNATEPEPNERGGGIFNKGASPTIRNCTFEENYAMYGGGIYNLASSHPLYENCIVINNTATKRLWWNL